jgi:hypothetical protein
MIPHFFTTTNHLYLQAVAQEPEQTQQWFGYY